MAGSFAQPTTVVQFPRTLMITVAWGNFLALVLPGVVVLVALESRIPVLASLTGTPDLSISAGIVLAVLATLAGGIVDGVRRVTFDLWIPRVRNIARAALRRKPDKGGVPNIYAFLTAENLDTFNAGVENSYKYYCLYAGLSLALIFLILIRAWDAQFGIRDLVLDAVAALLAFAAYVQEGFFRTRMIGFVEVEERRRREAERDVSGRSGTGNQGRDEHDDR